METEKCDGCGQYFPPGELRQVDVETGERSRFGPCMTYCADCLDEFLRELKPTRRQVAEVKGERRLRARRDGDE